MERGFFGEGMPVYLESAVVNIASSTAGSSV